MKKLALSAALSLTLLTGCAGTLHPAPTVAGCYTGEHMTQTTLYFGLSRPTGSDVKPAEWQNFIDDMVTPRFKEGLTVMDGQGQWLDSKNRVVREQSKALLLIHPAGPQQEKAIQAIRTAYKQRFQQESVMRVDTPVCASF